MRVSDFSAAILVGGQSRRMESRPKALLEVDGKTFLERIGEQLEDFEEKFLSIAPILTPELAGFTSVFDAFPASGPMSGIYSVLAASTRKGVLVVPCDTPLFSRDLARTLVSCMTPELDAIICRTGDSRAHPLCGIYSKSCLEVLRTHLEQDKLRIIWMLELMNFAFLDLPAHNLADSILCNINTPEEFASFADAAHAPSQSL